MAWSQIEDGLTSGEDAFNLDRREQRRGATTKEDGIGRSSVELFAPARRIPPDRIDISRYAGGLPLVGVEVAVGADVRAKGNVNVDPELVVRLGRRLKQRYLRVCTRKRHGHRRGGITVLESPQ